MATVNFRRICDFFVIITDSSCNTWFELMHMVSISFQHLIFFYSSNNFSDLHVNINGK